MTSEIQKAGPGMLDRDSEFMQTREWLDLIKKNICPAGISDDDFKMFVDKCRRSGMDPLQNEAFCVPRKVKVKKNGKEETVELFVFQASEQGMEARAHRFDDFDGIRAGPIYENDDIAIDFGEGKVLHRATAKNQGKLVGAWAIAYRRSKVPNVSHVLLSEYNQGQSQWISKPETMIVKCARAAALRIAYPKSFNGIYDAAEGVRDEKLVEGTAERIASAAPASASKTDELENFLKEKKAKGSRTVESKAVEKDTITTPDGTVKKITDASKADLEDTVKRVEAWLPNAKDETKKAEAIERVALIKAQLAKLDEAQKQIDEVGEKVTEKVEVHTFPEPGSEG